MINNPIDLSKTTDINRYALVVATAKCARIITDEYVKQKEAAEQAAMSKDNDKKIAAQNMINKDYRDEKAVKLAISGLHSGEFKLIGDNGEEIFLSENAQAKKIIEDEEVEFGEKE